MLSIDEIILKIKAEEIFQETVEDGSFTVIIEKYVPYVCTAIHNGSRLEGPLEEVCLLSKEERLYEEDPETGHFISSMPIRIIANDTRYAYDLNRSVDACIYEEAWGKRVWQRDLSDSDKETSLLRYKNFYRLLRAILDKINEKFGKSILFDVHSYNYKRIPEAIEAPVFNLGTHQIHKARHGKYINNFLKSLSRIEFSHHKTTVGENIVFQGKGYLASYVIKHHPKTLILPLEIKKIYCDELTGDIYPEVVQELTQGLKNAIVTTALYYVNAESNRHYKNRSGLLSSIDDPVLRTIDKKLYSHLKGMEVLSYVNPKNLESSRKRFFDSNYKKNPDFSYVPLKINVYDLKKSLYELPLNKIEDVSIQGLYKSIIDEQVTTIDLLASRGTDRFLYESLKLYDKPSPNDVMNANYLIQSAGFSDEEKRNLNGKQAIEYFQKELLTIGIGGKIALKRNMAARAMVDSKSRTLFINDKAMFNRNDLSLLKEHEIGVHLLSTMNALEQPLRCLSLGLPKNTETQEGLAILSEALTGYMPMSRLKQLAYRTIAVNLMVKGYGFKDIFEYFGDEFLFDKDMAYDIAARVTRGGGFTKDYVYLKGFVQVYNAYKSGYDLENLLIGKTSLEYGTLLDELRDRRLLTPLAYKNDIFAKGHLSNSVLKYVLDNLK